MLLFSGEGPTKFLTDFREALLDYTWYSEETNKTRDLVLLVFIWCVQFGGPKKDDDYKNSIYFRNEELNKKHQKKSFKH